MNQPAGVSEAMLIDALDSLTVAALAQVFSPRHQHQLLTKSYSTQIAEILAPRLTAALAGRAVVPGWQDIATAPKPKGGEQMIEVMVAGGTYYNSMSMFSTPLPFDGWTLACWDDFQQEWRGENSGGHDEFYYYKPTHWMPKIAPQAMIAASVEGGS